MVDGGDQAGAACQQEHGADAAGGEAVDALAEFVVDVGGGDHGDFAFGSGAIGDAVEDPPPALLAGASGCAPLALVRLRLVAFRGTMTITRNPP